MLAEVDAYNSRFAGRHVVTIVCSCNVDLDAYHGWVGAAASART